MNANRNENKNKKQKQNKSERMENHLIKFFNSSYPTQGKFKKNQRKIN